MSKPFFYRLNASDFFAIVRDIPDKECAKWLRTFSSDLVAGNTRSEYTQSLIDEAKRYKENKSLAGKKGMEKRYKKGGIDITELGQKENIDITRSSSSTVAVQKQKKKAIVGLAPDPAVIEVIEYLNGKTGAAFRPETKATTKHITARIKEGATVDDLLDVIDLKCEQWIGDPKMSGYLRPETLFNAEKFQSYSAEVARGPVIPKSKSIYADGLVL